MQLFCLGLACKTSLEGGVFEGFTGSRTCSKKRNGDLYVATSLFERYLPTAFCLGDPKESAYNGRVFCGRRSKVKSESTLMVVFARCVTIEIRVT